jgi:hypothetical protein
VVWLANAKLCRATGTTGSKAKVNSATPTPIEIAVRGIRVRIILSGALLDGAFIVEYSLALDTRP